MKRPAVLVICFALLAWPGTGQKLNPVRWRLGLEPERAAQGSIVLGRLTAQIDPGWHLYSLSTPKGGPIPTTITLADNPAVSAWKIYPPPATRHFDPNFNLETETYEKQADFLLEISLAPAAPAGPRELLAQIRFQCCDSKMCLPPRRVAATAVLLIDPCLLYTSDAADE
mgnify:CR=1 FL=1